MTNRAAKKIRVSHLRDKDLSVLYWGKSGGEESAMCSALD